MLNEVLLRQISDTSDLLGLDESVIEKDYYLTQVIHALSDLENDHFRLIFCGGTCLAKAHKLVKRMSEDVDFKVQLKDKSHFNRSQLKKALKEFRIQVRSKLQLPNFSIINDVARNEGKYQQITLKYPDSFPIGSTLRPDIKIELTVADILLSTDELYVKTLIEDTLPELTLFTPPVTRCVSIDETAVEKWVGLTRRIIAIERGYEQHDKALIRHVYDLNAINSVNINFKQLAKIVITNDSEQFKNLHPEYADNPSAEIKQSLMLLKNKKWQACYDEFIEAMVYDNTHVLSYDHILDTLERFTLQIIN